MSSEIYVVYSNGELAKINTSTFAVDEIGNTGLALDSGDGLTDIGFAPDGQLYGISFDELYKINAKTGHTTAIGGLGAGGGDMNALTFGANGKAYAYSADEDYLYTINLKTGQATALSSASGSYSEGDLTFYNGKLLLSGFSSLGKSELVTLNPSNGAATHSVSLKGDLVNLFGLTATNSTSLYGFNTTGFGSTMYKLNAGTGAAAELAQVDLPGDSTDYITGSAYDGYFKQSSASRSGAPRMTFLPPEEGARPTTGLNAAAIVSHSSADLASATSHQIAQAHVDWGAVLDLHGIDKTTGLLLTSSRYNNNLLTQHALY